MMVVTMDLDQENVPLNVGLFALIYFINNIMLCIIDVGVVINGYHHLRGGGDGAFTLHQKA